MISVVSGPSPARALAVARGYHDAWQRRDYQAAWQLLSDDLTVEVPVNSYHSKAAFAEAAQRTPGRRRI